MTGYINDYDFEHLEVMKYWQPPATWSVERKKDETRNRIFSGEWYGARKRDGALYVLLKDEDGNITLRGRSKSVNGSYLDKWNRLPHLHEWGEKLPNGCCFLGEVYLPGKEGSKNTTTIMNCTPEKAAARQTLDENKAWYYIFDVLAFDGRSFLNTCAIDRFNFLSKIEKLDLHPWMVEFAHYYCGERLWEELQTILAEGGEGMVITHENALYELGKRPSKTTLKCKKEIQQTIDCFFTGKTIPATVEYTGKELEFWQYWQNSMTGEKIQGSHYNLYSHGMPIVPITKGHFYGWAGSLQIGVLNGDGTIYELGWLSNLAESIKANAQDYKGHPIEVTAMEIFRDNGKITLRHAKMLQFRPDLTIKDCTIDKIIE